MLKPIADGVWVHESGFLRSNGVVVEGSAGVLLIDPGLTRAEFACLADDLRDLGKPVVAGMSTHPHWDHVLWDPSLGDAPRYGTAAAAAALQDEMSNPGWREQEAEQLPPEIAEDTSLDLFGQLEGLPAGATEVPWEGPRVRIIEHRAHAPGHAALLVEQARVFVAGDMLSDILIPFLDLTTTGGIDDYLAALDRFDALAADVDVVVPGHGSVGDADELRARIELDRAYVTALRGTDRTDPRLLPSAPNGEWLPDVHEWQRQQVRPAP